jgi:Zn-dependent protease with chaperone function
VTEAPLHTRFVADGGYFDGIVAARRTIRLSIEGTALHLQGDGFERSYPLSSVALTTAVGSVRRSIRLPDGGMCEVTDQNFLSELEQRVGAGTRAALLHRWEKSLALVAAALGVTALIVVLFMRYGVPVLARQAAFALPPAMESSMGRESLTVLDRLFTKPSKLGAVRRSELTALFRRVAVAGGASSGYRLEFRSGGAIGANAFALPSGIVLITDQLVELAKHDDEIAAILAHELGHVRQRHVLRHVLQNSATGLIIATLTGDLVSITSLAATLPTALVDASFSRAFEREADDAAISWMKSAGVPPRRYAEILGRLQAQLVAKHGAGAAGENPVRNYLSTHPDTGERIRRIMGSGGA